MTDLVELYKQVILDHNRSPRNFREMSNADKTIEGINPLCGDKIMLYINFDNNIVKQASFKGTGCAISIASSSLMTEEIIGKSKNECINLFNKIHIILTADSSHNINLGKLNSLSGVREYPSRVKCASLAWHALKSALTTSDATTTTE
ncbi:MAG: SUF system NifU family Fe-S cluster assembly protein [Pseudomonadota bacterium]|nr:SUF system NifU family Fe-S cluster assembly protein [Gammaproteobacteria bacterium]MEE2683480.1 SUF system NifU family Fe-S cluster assembly protein [Pseudomonadota bacterium]